MLTTAYHSVVNLQQIATQRDMHNYRLLVNNPPQLSACTKLCFLTPTTRIQNLGNPLPIDLIIFWQINLLSLTRRTQASSAIVNIPTIHIVLLYPSSTMQHLKSAL